MTDGTVPRKRWHPTRCRVCGTTEGPISTRAKCVPCAIDAQTKSATQLSAKDGRYYETWRARMVEIMPSREDRL